MILVQKAFIKHIEIFTKEWKKRMKNKVYKMMAFWLCLAVYLSVISITVWAEETTTDNTYTVDNYEDLKEVIDQINTKDSGEYVISLSGNIGIDDINENYLNLKKPVTVTILGNGHTISGTGNAGMFYVQGGACLILGNEEGTDTLILDANKKGYGIWVDNGILKMYEGVTMKGAKSSGNGGIHIYGESSKFYMHGGTITDCHVTATGSNGGGGITALKNSTLIITKGTISQCSAGKSGGGIWIDSNSSAEISNAVITNNTVGVYKENPGTYDGMSTWGGGICIGEGSAIIKNCKITYNTTYGWRGGGIYVGSKDSSVSINECEIFGNSSWVYGGGVSVFPLAYRGPETIESKTTITNSEIYKNKTGGYGGGIANEGGTVILENTKIYANNADGWGDDLISEYGYPKIFSVSLCAPPTGLTIMENEKTSSITGWYDDGSNVYGESAISTPLRWGDVHNGGYYCSLFEVPETPLITPIALKAAYDLNNVHEHVYEDWKSNTDGTHTGCCNVEGCNETKKDDCSGGTATCITLAKCSVCKEEYGSVDNTNHANYGTELKNQKESDCETTGYTGDICCKGCGTTLEKGEDILGGHSFEKEWNYNESDHWHICERCKKVGSLENHYYGDWVVKKEATVQTEGVKEKACICGHKIVESIPKKETIDIPDNHEHDYDEWTSNNNGTHTGTCVVEGCSQTLTKNCFGGQATCTEPAICQVCRIGFGVPRGHSFGTDWKYNENSHWHICLRCEEMEKMETHIFGDWVVIEEATTQSEGCRERACVCGYKVVESIAKDDSASSPMTGDSSDMAFLILLSFLSLSVMVGLISYEKKIKNQ